VRTFLQRWAPWIAVAVLVAGVAAFAATRLAGGGGSSGTTTSQASVPLDPKARAVAEAFVASAVARKDLAKSWELASPELRGHLTRADWLTGSIPVQPYPVGKATARYTVVTSHPDEAVLGVAFVPHSAATPPGDFLITLDRSGGTWLVSSWVPNSQVGPSS
jgi:hypothetical protein